jgi:PAS domain S-box-containing protein
VISHVAIAKDGEPIPEKLSELDGLTVAVMSGDITHDLILENNPPLQKLVVTETQQEALQLVADGKVDVGLAAKLPAMYWIEENQLTNLVVGEKSFVSPEYCYATRHGNGEILSIISEGLASLRSSGKYHQIYARHLGVYEGLDPGRLYLLFGIACVLFLLLIGSIVWSTTLKKEVRKRTRLLSEEVEGRKQSEEMISLLLNSTAEGIYGVNLEEHCTFCNSSAQKMLGYSAGQLLGRNVHNLVVNNVQQTDENDEEQQCLITEVLKTGEPRHIERGTMWRFDGSWFHVECWVHPIRHEGEFLGAVVTFLDISEKIKMQEDQLRSSQLAALGELAAGMAHEINNPINGIINYAQILQNRLTVEEPEKTFLNNIIKEGNRVAAIVANMLNFSQKGGDKKETVAVKTIIEEPLKLVARQFEHDGITLDVDLSDGDLTVSGNVLQLEQVILNLLSNARHALNKRHPQASVDKILRISAVKKTDTSGKVLITFWDQGCGIKAADKSSIFNPFFTTKEAGVGTGLGLSISHEIISAHKGTIHIESEYNYYTKVEITLPLAPVF